MYWDESRSISPALHKTQLKWIKDLSVRPDTLNLIKGEAGLRLHWSLQAQEGTY